MEALISGGFVLVLIFLFLGFGVWVFSGILLVAAGSLFFINGMDIGRIATIGTSISYRYATAWELAAIPMFIWMGEIIFRTDIASRLFRGLVPFANRIPGRLLHTNVLGCTLFAAISGSSAATAATVGKITLEELNARGYDRNLALGSLAGAGSLGLLIPPSIVMIVYGISGRGLDQPALRCRCVARPDDRGALFRLHRHKVPARPLPRPGNGRALHDRGLLPGNPRPVADPGPHGHRPRARSTPASPPRPRPQRSASPQRWSWRG